MQTGSLFIGGGLDQSDLKPVSADDVGRNASRNVIPRFFTTVAKTVNGEFREVEYVEILIPGDSKSVPVRMVDDNIRAMYAVQYQAWKSGKEQAAEGTPLEILIGNGPLLHQMRANHIHTVEALAGITDGQLDSVGMGARQLRDKANVFLGNKKHLDDLQAQEDKDAKITELMARLARLEGKPEPEVSDEDAPVSSIPPAGSVPVTDMVITKRGPGRPRKDA